mgnify:CR=1 FL=1
MKDLYPISDEKSFSLQEGDNVEIWVEGSCPINPGIGGYAVLLQYNGKIREMIGGYSFTTNNRITLMAAIVALESLKTQCKVTIYSDSRYLVDSIKSGYAKLRLAKDKKGNNKKELINADLWQRLLSARDNHKVGCIHKVKFIWVKRGSTPENERCNNLAEVAVLNPDLPKDLGYNIQKAKTGFDDVGYARFREKLDKIETAIKQGQQVDKV